VDIDPIADRFKHIVGHEPLLDQIAHGTYFGEGPVWDRRTRSSDPSREGAPWADACPRNRSQRSYAERVGLDPAHFAGHSMRSGFLTSAAKRGASIFKMMDQSRHRSVETLRGYVRDAEIFKEHAGAGLL
jgi:hypothetical protein